MLAVNVRNVPVEDGDLSVDVVQLVFMDFAILTMVHALRFRTLSTAVAVMFHYVPWSRCLSHCPNVPY